MSINSVNISGNLTREVDLKTTASGKSILNFGVAVNDRRKNPQTGEWEDVPVFVDCCMFGNRATALQQYLHKGAKVAIQGKLRYSSWDGSDGKKHSKLEVVVEEIEFMSQRQQQYQQPTYSAPQYAPQTYQQPAPQRPQQYAQPAPQPAPQPYQQPIEAPLAYDDIAF